MKNLSTLISYLVLFIIVVVGFESYGFAPKQLFKTKNFEKYKSSKVFSEIGLTTIAMNDAGLIPGFIEPTNNLNSGTNTALKVVLKNYGQLSLTSVQIPYSINGMIADTFFWSGSLSSAQMDTVIIDSISFIGGVFSIEAYTQLPNNVQDTVNANDTANINVSVCLNGVYSIGDTINGTANFGSFNGALASLNTAGICGNVTFNVEAGTYTEQLTINPINGSSSVHNITFQSANANNTSVVLQYNAIGSSPIHTIHFNGADYISFKDMTIKSLSSDSCKTIVINGGANHITIENNNIIMPVMASNAYGIYSSDGNDNYLNIVDNHIINGVFGIYLKGTSVTSREQWLNIENNHVEDYLAYGIYVFYQDYAVVTGNEVDANTNANYCEGIHFESIYNWFIVKNNKVTTLGGGN
ncbi:MAG: right-handed parallel beta-helix repeat-containing protein, partial [Bacteroidales bacterium]|nr:right-handed parallel beta-helix repeat-containing protein [Bacteroidales bacterium]